jgi:hypothetical protein
MRLEEVLVKYPDLLLNYKKRKYPNVYPDLLIADTFMFEKPLTSIKIEDRKSKREQYYRRQQESYLIESAKMSSRSKLGSVRSWKCLNKFLISKFKQLKNKDFRNNSLIWKKLKFNNNIKK